MFKRRYLTLCQHQDFNSIIRNKFTLFINTSVLKNFSKSNIFSQSFSSSEPICYIGDEGDVTFDRWGAGGSLSSFKD